MALYDRWTRAQLRAAARLELADPTGRWWSDTQLNEFIDDWQRELNNTFEFVWGTNTVTGPYQTIPLAVAMPGYHGVGRTYIDGRFMPMKSHAELTDIDRDWRDTVGTPSVCVYMKDRETLAPWPPQSLNLDLTWDNAIGTWDEQTGTWDIPDPVEIHTYEFEYPTVSTFASDSSQMAIPAWTKYTCSSYCLWRAYLMQGPNHDIQKSLRYRAQFQRKLNRLRRLWDNYFPQNAPRLVPGGRFERRMLTPFKSVLELPWLR